MKPLSIIIYRRRPNPGKGSFGTVLGFLLAGALLLAGIGWAGFERIAPASPSAAYLDPVMPLLPLTTVYLLNLQP
jgi:hypothetical protein